MSNSILPGNKDVGRKVAAVECLNRLHMVFICISWSSVTCCTSLIRTQGLHKQTHGGNRVTSDHHVLRQNSSKNKAFCISYDVISLHLIRLSHVGLKTPLWLNTRKNVHNRSVANGRRFFARSIVHFFKISFTLRLPPSFCRLAGEYLFFPRNQRLPDGHQPVCLGC